MAEFIFKPGNIWSGDKTGLAVLTNPTELAFRKGNLKRHYPIVYAGSEFEDAEAAYQHYKIAIPRQVLMKDVLIFKLRQHPQIAKAIARSGGAEFLCRCSHRVYGKSWWEGDGFQSPFIMVLIAAFKIHQQS